MAPALSGARARRLASVLAAIVLAALASAPAAGAQLLVEHRSTTATETAGNGDGLIGPGDSFSISEQVESAEAGTLTGVGGTLSSSTSGVTVTQGSSSYPDLPFGQPKSNDTLFGATIAPSVDCGANLQFNLALSTAQGNAQIPFTVGTGTGGPPHSHESTDVPRVLPDLSSISSNLQVGAGTRLKDVKVRIGRITHTAIGDLTLELVAPDGATVTLMNRRGGTADDLVNVSFSDAAAQSIATASAPYSGAYRPEEPLSKLVGHSQQGTWRLRITDSAGGDQGTLESWGMDLRSAVCDGSPQASFTASPNPSLPGTQVNFDASQSSDPNGSIVKYEWDLDGNGTFETDTGTSPLASYTYANHGLYQVHLRVTDDSTPTPATGTTMVPVSVTEPPTADFTATPPSPLTGEQVTLDGSSSSDPDGTITRYEWDLDGDGTFERDTGANAATTTTYSTPGTHPVRLRVTDQDGATAVKAIDLTVQNRAPTASFTAPSPAVVGTVTTFNGSASSDPDGSIVKYEWDLDGNGTFETDTGTNSQATRTYAASGDVSVKLRVTDDNGATATQTQTVRVTRAPVADFSASPNPVSLDVTVTFTSTSGDPDGAPIAKHEWDLDGDGTFETDTGTVPSASRSYAANGTYAVKLRVTDVDGATATKTVNVVASNGLPIAMLTATPNPAVAGSPVTLDASASSDPDGTLVKYEWDLDGNGTYEVNGGTTPVRAHTYPTPGTFDVGVRVTDNHGGTATRSLTLVVNPPGGGGSEGGGGSGSTSGGGAGTGAGGGAGGAGAGGGGGDGGPTAGPLARLGGTPIQRLSTVLARGLALTCESNRVVTCNLQAELRPGDARRLGLTARNRAVVVGRLRVAVSGRTRQARLRLTAAGRRALRRTRRVTLVVRGTAVGVGLRVALTRTFLVRR